MLLTDYLHHRNLNLLENYVRTNDKLFMVDKDSRGRLCIVTLQVMQTAAIDNGTTPEGVKSAQAQGNAELRLLTADGSIIITPTPFFLDCEAILFRGLQERCLMMATHPGQLLRY